MLQPTRIHRPARSLIAAMIMTALGQAQAAEDPFFEDLPTVLTVSRLPQVVDEAPGAVTIIDREQIRASGYRDLARIFRLVPGMQVGQERGHWNWVTYHGLGNNYPSEMQVLVDGRSVYSPSAFGGMDWSALPLAIDEIERIEVLRGSNAATYGANAFLGVINIITRHSALDTGTRLHARAGSQGIGDLAGSSSLQAGAMNLRFSAATRHDNGFDSLQDSHHVSLASLRGDMRLSKQDELLLRLAASDFRRGEGYPVSTFDNNDTREARGQYYTLHLQWTRARSANDEWILNFYHNQERVRDEWNASAPSYPVVPLSRNRESTRDHLELQHRFALNNSTQLVWGGELRRDNIESPFLYASGSRPIHMVRGFGNLEWRSSPSLSFNFGTAVERFSGEPTHFAPRLFANWKATPSDTFRIGGARAYQQRPTFEKDGDVRAIDPASNTLLVRPYVPNPNLRQPRMDSFELGYLGRFRPRNTTIDVRAFNERIQGYIVRLPYTQPQSPMPLLNGALGSSQYANYGTPVVLRGVEYEIKLRPWERGQLAFTHTLIDRSANDAYIEARTAPYTATLSWTQDWKKGWTSMISVLRMGPMAGGDGFVPLYPYVAKPYTTVDARIAWATQIGKRRAEFSLNAINIGSNHQEIADRSQQAVLPAGQVANPVSPMVYFGLSLDL